MLWVFGDAIKFCPFVRLHPYSQALRLDRLTWLSLRMRSVLPKRGILS